MRLAVFKHLEAEILHHRRRADNTKLSRVQVMPGPAPMQHLPVTTTMNTQQLVDYRIWIGAQKWVNEGDGPKAFDEAKDRVCQMLAREIYGDLTDELLALFHWADEEGYDKAMLNRIGRLIDLTTGKDVQDA